MTPRSSVAVLLVSHLALLLVAAAAQPDPACTASFAGTTELFDACRLDLAPGLRVYYRVAPSRAVLETLLHADPVDGGFVGWGWFSAQMVGTTAVVAYRAANGVRVRNYFLGGKSSGSVVPTNSILIGNATETRDDGSFAVLFRQTLPATSETSAVWALGSEADAATGTLQYHGPMRGVVTAVLRAPTTAAPTTVAPTTKAATKAPSTTVAPTTTAATKAPATTVAPTTKAPTTAAPTTKVTTAAPTTVAPTTKATTKANATTKVPATVAPTTKAAITKAPSTEAATTKMPMTEAVTAKPPTTEPEMTEPAITSMQEELPGAKSDCTAMFAGDPIRFQACDEEVSPAMRVYWSVLRGDKTLQTLVIGTPPAGGYIAWGWFSSQMYGTNAVVAYALNDYRVSVSTYRLGGKRADQVTRNDSNPVLNAIGTVAANGTISAWFTQPLPALGETPAVWSLGTGVMNDDGDLVLDYHGRMNRGVERYTLESSGEAAVDDTAPESSPEDVADPFSKEEDEY